MKISYIYKNYGNAQKEWLVTSAPDSWFSGDFSFQPMKYLRYILK